MIAQSSRVDSSKDLNEALDAVMAIPSHCPSSVARASSSARSYRAEVVEIGAPRDGHGTGLHRQDDPGDGIGRNIGRAIILEFAGRGANVIINPRSNRAEAEAVESEARALGAETLIVMGAPADLAVVDELQQRAEAAFGRVDIYVSNAARRPFKDFWETTNEEWHEYLNQQLTASWYLAKAFAPGMRDAGYGRIIHMNGPDGYRGGWTAPRTRRRRVRCAR